MLDLQGRSHSGDGAPPSCARPARTISQRRRSSALPCSTCKDDLTAETELRPPVLDLQGRSHSGDGAPPSRARPARTISQRRRSSALPCSTCKDDLTAETELRPPVLDLQGRSHSGDGAPPSCARPARTISQRRRSSALPCSTCKEDLTAETELRPPVLDLQGRSHSGDGAPPSRSSISSRTDWISAALASPRCGSSSIRRELRCCRRWLISVRSPPSFNTPRF